MSFEELLHMESHGSFEESELLGIDRVLKEMTEEQAQGFIELMNVNNIDLSKIKFNERGVILNKVIYAERYQFVDLTAFAPLAGSKVRFSNMSMDEVVVKMIENCKKASDEIQDSKDNGDYEKMFSLMDKKFLNKELYDLVMDYRNLDKGLSTGFMRGYIRMESGFDIFDDEFIEVFTERISDCHERKGRIDELRKMANEDGILKVYHGAKKDFPEEFSWTVNRDIAVWFGKRFDGHGFVIEGETHIDDVIDYYTSRGESEVLVLPDLVNVTNVEEV